MGKSRRARKDGGREGQRTTASAENSNNQPVIYGQRHIIWCQHVLRGCFRSHCLLLLASHRAETANYSQEFLCYGKLGWSCKWFLSPKS